MERPRSLPVWLIGLLAVQLAQTDAYPAIGDCLGATNCGMLDLNSRRTEACAHATFGTLPGHWYVCGMHHA